MESAPFFFYDRHGECYVHDLPEEYVELIKNRDIAGLHEERGKLWKNAMKLKLRLQTYFYDAFSNNENVFFDLYSKEFPGYDDFNQAFDAYITMRINLFSLKKAIDDLLEDNK